MPTYQLGFSPKNTAIQYIAFLSFSILECIFRCRQLSMVIFMAMSILTVVSSNMGSC